MRPMVDLRSQYLAIQDQIDRGLNEVIENTAFINGPAVKAFAEELGDYLGGVQVIPCANGTDALQIAMMALGLQPGDELITASFTYVATAEAIALLRLRPVLVDVDPVTFALDPEQVRAAIGPKTRAIVPVHLFGQCAPMEPILALAREKILDSPELMRFSRPEATMLMAICLHWYSAAEITSDAAIFSISQSE
jgi:dTDP-4-amino-4,6-dideoxygalactose transaminase